MRTNAVSLIVITYIICSKKVAERYCEIEEILVRRGDGKVFCLGSIILEQPMRTKGDNRVG